MESSEPYKSEENEGFCEDKVQDGLGVDSEGESRIDSHEKAIAIDSTQEPPVQFAADKGNCSKKRKIHDDDDENSEVAEEPLVEENICKISVKKFTPLSSPVKPAIDPVHTPEHGFQWPISSGDGSYCPQLNQNLDSGINPPNTSESGPMQAFLNLILQKGNTVTNNFENTTEFIKEIITIIKLNINGLHVDEAVYEKMYTFCDTLNLVCEVSSKQLEPFQEFEQFFIKYAQIVNSIIEDNNQSSKNYEEKMLLKQQILEEIHSCKKHLDEVTHIINKSIAAENALRFNSLMGTKTVLSDGTPAVVVNLESSSDEEEEGPSISSDGINAIINIKDVLSLDIIQVFIDLVADQDHDDDKQFSLPSDITESLIFKAPYEVSSINVSGNLLVIGFLNGKITYINLLTKEIFEEKNNDHNSKIISIEIWKKYIISTSDKHVRCLNLGKKDARAMFSEEPITAMSSYGGLLHIGTINGRYYKLSLPALNFVNGPSIKICDSSITSLNVVKGTQSGVVLLGTSEALYLWNKNEEFLINKFTIYPPRMLRIYPELVLSVTDDHVMKASTSEMHLTTNLFHYKNPWSEGSCVCILNGEAGDILVGCRNGEFAHFNQNLIFLGKVNRYEEGPITCMIPWRDKVVACNGTSIFLVSTINPIIKIEPEDIEYE